MKRFYKNVDVRRQDGDQADGSGPGPGWQVTLDERGVKTVGGAAQIVPSHAIARSLAAEWEAQGQTLDPKSFVLRDLADYAIDVVARQSGDVVEKLLNYGETDTLLYRADPDEPLYARQLEIWEPIVAAFEAREGVELVRISGIVHRPQPDATMARFRKRLCDLDPFALAGMEIMASLACSLTTALNAAEPDANSEEFWDAASLEEEWQAELWGRDEEAENRRNERKAQFLTACDWVRAVRHT